MFKKLIKDKVEVSSKFKISRVKFIQNLVRLYKCIIECWNLSKNTPMSVCYKYMRDFRFVLRSFSTLTFLYKSHLMECELMLLVKGRIPIF